MLPSVVRKQVSLLHLLPLYLCFSVTMASKLFLALLVASLSSLAYSQAPQKPPLQAPSQGPSPAPSGLSLDYYAQSCPKLEEIVLKIVTEKHRKDVSTAAGLLRIFFHDCMVDGCDASVMIGEMPHKSVEKEAEINLSLAGDGFAIVHSVKDALELACPGVVSCADIMALSTRNLVKMLGGPFYNVTLGRKDGLVSEASHVEGNLARVNFTMDTIIKMFEAKGFNIEEMVALTGGGHTVGFANCKEFAYRVWNFNSTHDADPTLHPKFVERLRQQCANHKTNTSMAAFLDVMSPGQFDNTYFKNLIRGLGLLQTDSLLFHDPRTKPFVERFAKDEKDFFQVFAKSMLKTSLVGVKTGNEGNVRHRCDKFNNS